MPSILVLSGSPSATSRTAAVLDQLALRLGHQDHDVRTVSVRDLPPADLLAANTNSPEIAAVAEAVAAADGLVVASPIYKAAYTGLLKAVLDLLPQFALAGKTVLPLATGGSPAHVLALDYAFRPVLSSMGAEHVVQGYFLLDQLITRTPDGVQIAPEAEAALLPIVDAFSNFVHRRAPLGAAS